MNVFRKNLISRHQAQRKKQKQTKDMLLFRKQEQDLGLLLQQFYFHFKIGNVSFLGSRRKTKFFRNALCFIHLYIFKSIVCVVFFLILITFF